MPLLSLSISGDDREVLVPSLPQGQSWVRLDLVWAPGDEDATIDVGTVTSGTVHAAMGKGRVTVGDTPGYIELWGE
jgi:hypothetical protein